MHLILDEVFVAFGVLLIGVGVHVSANFARLIDDTSQGRLISAVSVGAVAWRLADYLTRRGRMVLPSLVQVVGFAFLICLAA